MARLPKNTVYVYYYAENTGNASYYGGTRVVVCKTFAKAYEELERDVRMFENRYGAVADSQWVNDPTFENATSTSVALLFPDGRVLDLHIAPAVPY